MEIEVVVPRMGESITEATVGSILKPSGSYVNADDELLELETDKVNQVLYAPQSGLFNLKVAAGDVVKIGQVVGYVDPAAPKSNGKKGAVKPPKASELKEELTKEAKPVPTAAKQAPEPIQSPTESRGEAIRMTKNIFIEDLKSGEAFPRQAPETPMRQNVSSAQPTETRRKMTKIRKVIAQRLVEAQQTTAMLTTFNEVDMTEVMALREKYKELFQKEYKTKLGFMSFFVKAAVSALDAFPEVNSYIDGDDIVHREYYHIGIAVGTDKGLVVPVVRDCDKLSMAQIESAIEKYAVKAREGSLVVDDLQGGGFTITNGGTYGSLLSTPILNPPQSGILGMHKISKRAVVINDQIVIRPMMYVALSYDHRIVDGKEAVSFLVHLKNCLEDPARMLLEI